MLNRNLLILVFIMYSFVAPAQQKLDVQGHRGARGLMPENTIPAMKKALDYGVTTLELDLSISKDKLPLVSHEPYFSATISLTPEGNAIPEAEEKNYNLYKLTYDEIRKYDVGSKPHPDFPEQQKMVAYKPLLAELIDSVERYAASRNMPPPHYNIEIKASPEGDKVFHPEPEEFVALVMQVVQEKGIQERLILQSFDPRVLEQAHSKHPDIPIAFLVSNLKGLEANLQRLSFQPAVYSPYHKLVNSKIVEACHEKGIRIIPWTVNDKTRIRQLVRMGVDGIITDYPDRVEIPAK
ncbi:glycerophosphodiester phosphodiesterase [Pontibacter diazotrophicus]|uniref:Glycerophosphodiester phosphodiesterase n=1 Tax=Pontibacter diazotrophicus TaxID=1400979 RepID=A0A3D8LB98_9BACT|nr:glycerophosphodiester phosphodiesterase [Pontibacter diazotrophicus]RDV14222.1 glycerophosphodiester phosphodiesterase [Pontibacter diazotrophicus]